MPFPLIFGAIALASTLFGGAKAVEGFSNINEAKEMGERAQQRYDRAVSLLKAEWQLTQQLAEEYAQLQLNVKMRTIGQFIAFIERIGQRGPQSDKQFLEGLEGISIQQIKEYKAAVLEAEQFVKGGFKAVGPAAAAGQGALGLVGLFGSASTGTAISGLSGAARANAS